MCHKRAIYLLITISTHTCLSLMNLSWDHNNIQEVDKYSPIFKFMKEPNTNLILYSSNLNLINDKYYQRLFDRTSLIIFNDFNNTFTGSDHVIINNSQNDFVVFIEKREDIKLAKMIFIKANANTFFIFLNQFRLFYEISEMCVKLQIFNSLIIVHQGLRVQAYQPNFFESQVRCGKAKNIKSLNQSAAISRKTNFSNCTLKISWIEGDPFVYHPKSENNPGLFIWLFTTISKHINVTIEFQDENKEYESEVRNNGTLWKLINELHNGKFDLALGRLYMNISQDAPFDFGPLVYVDKMIFIFPKAKPLAIYRNLLAVFSTKLWLLFLTVFFLVVIIVLMIAIFVGDYDRCDTSDIIISIFRITIGSGTREMTDIRAIRIILLFYLMYSLNMDAIYLGKLSSIFTKEATGLEIKDDYTLFKHTWKKSFNWRYERFSYSRHLFGGNPGYISSMIIENFSDYEVLRRTAFDELMCGNAFKSVVDAHPYEASQIHTFQLLWYNITLLNTYYMHKNNPINPVLVYWSQELIEKGFIVHWWKMIKDINAKIAPPSKHTELAVKLKLAHYEEAAQVLISGYIFATVVLLMEFIIVWANKQVEKMENRIISFPYKK